MKIITKPSCCDTIRLEDVDLNEHYVVAVQVSRGFACIDEETEIYWIRKLFDKIITPNFGLQSQWTSGATSLKKLVKENKGRLEFHAFNSLHEMLDFVKENT